MLKKAFVLPAFMLAMSGLGEASQVLRKMPTEDGGIRAYAEDQAEFRLDLNIEGLPKTVEDVRGQNMAQSFQMTLDHRKGVRLPAKKLVVGDLLLEPLMLLSLDGDAVELLPAGHEIVEDDFKYLRSKAFRSMYDGGGVQIFPDQFKVGDALDVYTLSYDERNNVFFKPSGFLTEEGIEVIPYGATLNQAQIAMLNTATPMPVRVRNSVELKLEAYLRVDWPGALRPKLQQYWVKRDGEPLPLQLFSYQIEEGDRPLADIVGADGKVICMADTALSESGKRNSIEALDATRDAVMLSEKGLPITSVDPITGDPNDATVEPGDMTLAPRNQGEYLRPFLISSDDEMNEMLLNENYSFCRAMGAESAEYPFYAQLTRYIVPFKIPCKGACDALVEVSDAVMKGSVYCDSCDNDLKFRPYVLGELPAYSYVDPAWKEDPIHCSICDASFTYRTAHATAGNADEMVEIDHPIASNFIHPSRIRRSRLGGEAYLRKDVTFFRNGEAVTIPEESLADDELRYLLEDRACSPLYISTPDARTSEAAQCPNCFAWNVIPVQLGRLQGEMGVDEVRRAMACFPLVEGRVNRLDLVVFGLSSETDEVTGRSMAKVITFRRFGDEHFNHVQGWKVAEERWAYLPKYQHEKGFSLPTPLRAGAMGGSSVEEDLFEDDF